MYRLLKLRGSIVRVLMSAVNGFFKRSDFSGTERFVSIARYSHSDAYGNDNSPGDGLRRYVRVLL